MSVLFLVFKVVGRFTRVLTMPPDRKEKVTLGTRETHSIVDYDAVHKKSDVPNMR